MKKLIFISHRHADTQIAKCIRNTLLKWKVPEDNIFVSSVPEASGLTGQPVETEIIEKIRLSGLLIIVLTDPSEDWEYVTMEYGIARGIENKKPNIVVFECGGQSHKLFNNINIKVDQNNDSDIRKFTHEFHTLDNYITGEKAPGKEMNDKTLISLAKSFHTELKVEIPDVQANVLHRWPLIVLTLPAEVITELKSLDELDQESIAIEHIYESATVFVRRGPVEPMFGLGVEKDPDSPWKSYVEQWKSSFPEDSFPPSDWIDSIHLELFKAIKERPPNRLEKTILNPVNKKEYIMSFPRMKRYADGRMDFDVYIYPVIDSPGG